MIVDVGKDPEGAALVVHLLVGGFAGIPFRVGLGERAAVLPVNSALQPEGDVFVEEFLLVEIADFLDGLVADPRHHRRGDSG